MVRLGSLNQRQLENFFQTQKFEIYKQNFHFFLQEWIDRYIDQGEFEFQTGFSVLKSPNFPELFLEFPLGLATFSLEKCRYLWQFLT